MTRDGVELFMTPWSSQAPSFGVWYMVKTNKRVFGTNTEERIAVRLAEDGNLHFFDLGHCEYLASQSITGLGASELISGGAPNFANLRLMVELGYPAVAKPETTPISPYVQTFKHVYGQPANFDPTDSNNTANYLSVSEVFLSFPTALTSLTSGPILASTPATSVMVVHGTVVAGAGTHASPTLGQTALSQGKGVGHIKQRIVRPKVLAPGASGATSDDNELEAADWVVMNQITVLPQRERFYTHTFRQQPDGSFRAYVCMFTDRVILEPAYSPSGLQYPLLHPSATDFTYQTGDPAFDADMTRFRELILNQQSPVLNAIVNQANDNDTASYALGFRYRGMYGQLAPADYAIPYANGGSMSLRSIALEVKDPTLVGPLAGSNANTLTEWHGNFRNIWYTQTGILADSFELRVSLAGLVIDHWTAISDSRALTEAQLFGTGNTRNSTGLVFDANSVPTGAMPSGVGGAASGTLNEKLLPWGTTVGAWHAVGPAPILNTSDPALSKFNFKSDMRRTLEAVA